MAGPRVQLETVPLYPNEFPPLAIGVVATGAPGTQVAANVLIRNGEQQLDLTIPQGAAGDTSAAEAIASQATVTAGQAVTTANAAQQSVAQNTADLGNRVRFDAAQTLTAAQKTQALANAGAMQAGLVPINVTSAPYNIVPDGATDNSAAIQQAINDGIAQGRTVYFPAQPLGQTYTVNTSIIINGPVSIVGDDERTSVIRMVRNNAPLFICNVNGQDWSGLHYRKMRFEASGWEAADDYSQSVVFFITGDAGTFFQYNRFEDLTVAGFSDGLWRSNKTSTLSSFGLEAPVAWNTFSRVHLMGFSRACLRGWSFLNGSGTGNHWSQITGNPTTTFISYAGNGAVVGDVLFENSHLAGVGTTSVIRVDDNTLYRENIIITGCQLDAGCAIPFDLSRVGTKDYVNVKYIANNTGGGANLAGIPAIRSGKMENRGISSWEMGLVLQNLPGGSQSYPAFGIELGANECVMANFVVSGVVQGVAVGIGIETWLIKNVGGSVSANQATAQGNPNTTFYSLVFNADNSTGRAFFGVSLSPTVAGSNLDLQLETRGGKHSAWINA